MWMRLYKRIFKFSKIFRSFHHSRRQENTWFVSLSHYPHINVWNHRRIMTTLNREASSILHNEAAIYIGSHYCNANGTFLFTPEGRLTLWTTNCNSRYVVFIELAVWLFSSVTFTMNNSVNNVHNLKHSFRKKSAASWMVVVSLPRESYVALHSDVCDIPMSFQVQLLVEDHVQWWAILLTVFQPCNCNILSCPR